MELKVEMGNIIHYEGNGFWVNQSFEKKIIVNYEDSDGNYWDNSYSIDNPYPIFYLAPYFKIEGMSDPSKNINHYYSNITNSYYVGDTSIGKGLVFAPYIPLMTEPITFGPPKRLMSGYSVTVNPDFYGVITLV